MPELPEGPDLSVVTTLELWKELQGRFDARASVGGAAIFACSDVDDAGQRFWRIERAGDGVACYGLATLCLDKIKDEHAGIMHCADNQESDDGE